jgi:hypothetical protein
MRISAFRLTLTALFTTVHIPRTEANCQVIMDVRHGATSRPNRVCVALVQRRLCADALPQQPLLNEAGRFSVFAIPLGIAVTAVYLAGLILRRNYSILGMGLDSFIVLLLYAGGLMVLFHLR